MTLLQFLAKVAAAFVSFEGGQAVPIQFDPWNTKFGIKLAFTPGNVDLTIPSGQMFAFPLDNDEVTIPALGTVKISADTNAVVLQKASA